MNQSSLYIHPDNQTILWDLINKTQYFVNVPNKEEWFRNIISQFYQQMGSANQIPKTKEELLNVNKQTLKYMVSQLNEKYNKNNSTVGADGFTPFQQGGNGGDYNNQYSTRNYEVYNVNDEKKKKADEDNAKFNKFETEYHSLLKPIPPVTVDFSQPITDGKIGNIDDVIKQHEKNREADLAKYMHPHPSPVVSKNQNQEELLKQKIQGISANTSPSEIRDKLFSEPKFPKELIISPPPSENWSSFSTRSQDNLVSYNR
jgi:hypothetical protein